jgi:hypothetical protein
MKHVNQGEGAIFLSTNPIAHLCTFYMLISVLLLFLTSIFIDLLYRLKPNGNSSIDAVGQIYLEWV